MEKEKTNSVILSPENPVHPVNPVSTSENDWLRAELDALRAAGCDMGLLRQAFEAQGNYFRGEIWEDDANVGLSQDDAGGNKPFDIHSCYYWKPVLEAGNKETTRMIAVTAANQVGKSLICELIARHKIKHDPGNMVLYDHTEPASVDHMKMRFMPFLKSIPAIGAMISDVEADNRFNVTTDDIKLPGMILRGRALNEQGTQRITARYVFVHDACLSERNGMLRRVRLRFTQAESFGNEFFMVESQGGVVGEDDKPDDFTALTQETDDADLWVKCPCCGNAQIFTMEGWTRKRGEDFQATLPRAKVLEILNKYDCGDKVEEVMEWQRKQMDTYSHG